jgi:hypothetical protein
MAGQVFLFSLVKKSRSESVVVAAGCYGLSEWAHGGCLCRKQGTITFIHALSDKAGYTPLFQYRVLNPITEPKPLPVAPFEGGHGLCGEALPGEQVH